LKDEYRDAALINLRRAEEEANAAEQEVLFAEAKA
jgi:hypothetical protein